MEYYITHITHPQLTTDVCTESTSMENAERTVIFKLLFSEIFPNVGNVEYVEKTKTLFINGIKAFIETRVFDDDAPNF